MPCIQCIRTYFKSMINTASKFLQMWIEGLFDWFEATFIAEILENISWVSSQVALCAPYMFISLFIMVATACFITRVWLAITWPIIIFKTLCTVKALLTTTPQQRPPLNKDHLSTKTTSQLWPLVFRTKYFLYLIYLPRSSLIATTPLFHYCDQSLGTKRGFP